MFCIGLFWYVVTETPTDGDKDFCARTETYIPVPGEIEKKRLEHMRRMAKKGQVLTS